jgi:uncharacterized protein (DUF736 family)
MPDRENEIGALWEKTSAKGTTYWTGNVNGVAVVIFRSAGDNPKAPTHRVYKSEPRQAATTTSKDGWD